MNKHERGEHICSERDLDYRGMKSRTSIILALIATALLGLLWYGSTHAQTATFTATRDATVNTTFRLAWSMPGAATCTAGKTTGWNGSVPTSGTRTLTSVALKMTLTLDCNASSSNGSARLDWTPPTTNSDGTPLTNLGGYRLFYSKDAPTLNQTIDIAVSGATSYPVAGLEPGLYHFALSALSSQCFPVSSAVTCRMSAQSNVATKTVAATPGAALPQLTVDLDPFPTPDPPTGLTVTDVTAFEIKQNTTGAWTKTRVAYVQPGQTCDPTQQRTVGTVTYTLIPMVKPHYIGQEGVDFANFATAAKFAQLWARCGG